MPGPSLERRKSDFHGGGAVTAYTGSGCCCCCCCLHWIGAAVGGGIGMRKSWNHHAKEVGPPHASVRRVMTVSLLLGFLLNAIPVLCVLLFHEGALRGASFTILGVAAFVPMVVFLPANVLSVLAAYRLRRSLRASYARELNRPQLELPKDGGAYREPTDRSAQEPRDLAALDGFETCCEHCWAPIQSGNFVVRCPSCSASIARPVFHQADAGVRLAWRMTLGSWGGSFLGGVAGYVLMVIISALWSFGNS